jgi:TatA/E family protein of Tat protein translocase
MFNIGPFELIVILVVALVVVGPKRLPELAHSIGRGLAEFRRAQEEVRRTVSLGLDEPASTSDSARQPRPSDPNLPSEEGSADAGEGPAPSTSGVAEVARTLGQGVAELGRVREEIRRSLEANLDAEDSAGPNTDSPRGTGRDPDGEPEDPPPPPAGGVA